MEKQKLFHKMKKQKAIAIIGMGCRFPGGIDSPDEYWRILENGVDTIVEVPPERWSNQNYYDEDSKVQGKTISKWGGFIQDIDKFDPMFFGISPNEANYMDPQQRLLLEVMWETLENGGQIPSKLRGKDIGVFIGAFCTDYHIMQNADPIHNKISNYSAIGSSNTIISNRISYLYDWKGPSLTLDTACSSSLVALHYACESLRRGECSAAAAGGVLLMLSPGYSIVETKGGFLSPDGRCKTFDDSANGYVRGEGVGIVLLKRLQDAIDDGDKIEGIILGSSVNQDGKTAGITVPNPESQKRLMIETCKKAGIKPADIQYIEAHGTGTKVGDPIEASAIGNVYGKAKRGKDKNGLKRSLYVGSCKTNIGHTESAAGIAGLIKTILMLQHHKIVPNLHFHNPNNEIPFKEYGIKVPTELMEWETNDSEPRIAAVNSFGFGGTNAHVILLEAIDEWKKDIELDEESGLQEDKKRPYLLPISARSEESLSKLTEKYFKMDYMNITDFDLCYNAATYREEQEYRKVLLYQNRDSLLSLLSNSTSYQKSEIISGKSNRKTKGLVWVFSGMGAPWQGMGRHLFEKETVYHETFMQCDTIFKKYSGISLVKELYKSQSEEEPMEVQIIQPMHFALQVSLAEMWNSFGIKPEVIVGHSVGEVAAFYVAGFYELEEAIRIVYHRSRLLQKLSGIGGMLAAELTREEADQIKRDYEGEVYIGCVNSSQSITLSGRTNSLNKIRDELKNKNRKCKLLNVNVPFHSDLILPIEEEFKCSLGNVQTKKGEYKVFSTVTGNVTSEKNTQSEYWWLNICNTVQFYPVMERLIEEGYYDFLEIGAHPVLLNAIAEIPTNETKLLITSMKRKEEDSFTFFQSLATLYVNGYPIEWKNLYNKGKRIELPTYAWKQEAYWNEPESQKQKRLGIKEAHFLGRKKSGGCPNWEFELSIKQFPFLKDHVVLDQITYPAACYLTSFMEACNNYFQSDGYTICNLKLLKSLILEDNKNNHKYYTVQTYLDPSTNSLKFYAEDDMGEFQLCATARIEKGQYCFSYQTFSIDELNNQFTMYVNRNTIYQRLAEEKFQYGVYFRGVKEAWYRKDECIAKVELIEELEEDSKTLKMHPTILDACFHSLIIADSGLQTSGMEEFRMPVEIEKCVIYEKPSKVLWTHAKLKERTDTATIGDLWIYNENGKLIGEVLGFKRICVGKNVIENAKGWLHELTWEHAIAPNTKISQSEKLESKKWIICIGDDDLREAFHAKLQAIECNYIDFSLWSHMENQCQLEEDYKELLEQQPDYILFSPRSSKEKADSSKYVKEACIYPLLRLMRILAKGEIKAKLYTITRGLQYVIENDVIKEPFENGVLGLLRTFATEYQNEMGFTIDFEENSTNEMICEKSIQLITDKYQSMEYAYRNGNYYIPKLKKVNVLNHSLAPSFHANGIYIIVGAFGAITREIVPFMIQNGAKQFAFITKTSITEEREHYIRNLEKEGTFIDRIVADVTKMQEIEPLITDLKKKNQILGVVYAAGVLKDTLLENTTESDFDQVFDTKAYGAWNLHNLLKKEPLEFFALFSSIASTYPGIGQGSYAAANCVLDAIAIHRRVQGLPAISLNWGPWAIGMVKDKMLEEYYKKQGMKLLEVLTGKDLFWRALSYNHSQLFIVNGKQFEEESKIQELEEEEFSFEEFLNFDGEKRYTIIKDKIIEMVSKSLCIEKEEIEVSRTFISYGLESLEAVHLRDQIRSQFRCSVLIGELIGGMSIESFLWVLSKRVDNMVECQ